MNSFVTPSHFPSVMSERPLHLLLAKVIDTTSEQLALFFASTGQTAERVTILGSSALIEFKHANQETIDTIRAMNKRVFRWRTLLLDEGQAEHNDRIVMSGTF